MMLVKEPVISVYEFGLISTGIALSRYKVFSSV